jgi:type IV/VI secretion system ImpK/VasF family protein
LYPALVFFVDELILREPGGRGWTLLQQEFFEISDGGERFFDLIDQRLAVAQTSTIVFEVFFFLLSEQGSQRGFQGRYSGHVESIAQYRRRLQERIQAPVPTQRKIDKRRQPRKDKGLGALVERPLPTSAYYAVALGLVLFLSLVTMWLSDLPDLGASRKVVS